MNLRSYQIKAKFLGKTNSSENLKKDPVEIKRKASMNDNRILELNESDSNSHNSYKSESDHSSSANHDPFKDM
jgi:hypothetical protein